MIAVLIGGHYWNWNRHRTLLGRCDAKDTTEVQPLVAAAAGVKRTAAGKPVPRKVVVKIGRLGYEVTKIRDPATRQFGLLLQIQYPEIEADPSGTNSVRPGHRFMSAYEQKVEEHNKAYQYFLFACDSYETKGKFWTHWDPVSKTFSLQLFFRGTRGMGT
ncbi:hypothetical protein BJ742DRAFT_671810 [Cladochytrium replicatum]|nr:hypothetical protein BJ742DRAFT_671810 [Cladochytrium replicatum]